MGKINDIIRGLFSPKNKVEIVRETLYSCYRHTSGDGKMYYNISPEIATKLVKNLFHAYPTSSDMKNINYLIRVNNTGGKFDVPKSPVKININKCELSEGVKRIYSIMLSTKTAIVWIETEEDL